MVIRGRYDFVNFFSSATQVQERKNAGTTVALGELMGKCAKLANREVKNGRLLSEYQNGYKVSMIEFKNNGKDLLAWLVLEDNETFNYCVFPATYQEDSYSGWRFEDYGELTEDMFFVLCTVQNQQETVVYLGWYDGEGENVCEVTFTLGKAATQKSVSGRYTYPM